MLRLWAYLQSRRSCEASEELSEGSISIRGEQESQLASCQAQGSHVLHLWTRVRHGKP